MLPLPQYACFYIPSQIGPRCPASPDSVHFGSECAAAILTCAADKISMSSPFMPTHCAGIGMNEHIHSHVFATTAALDEQLAIAVASWLDDALRQRGEALLVVSGGRTPIHFFHRLATQAIEWEKIAVTLADERWVEPSHEGSNEKLVREHLLIGA